jgi:PAS domain S-box-containing protein
MDEREQALLAENARLKKTVSALMDRAERSTNGNSSDFSLFQTTILLEEQIRHRTEDLRAALLDNEKINRALSEAKNQAEGRYAELQLTQIELQRSEERFKNVCLASNDVIWDIDLQTGQTWISPNFEREFDLPIHGVSPSVEELQGYIHPDDRARILDDFSIAAQNQEKFWSGEFRHVKGDGSYVHVLSRAYLLRSENQVATRFVGAITNLTQQKRADEAQLAKDLAEKSNLAKSTFLSRMSHELRTPLNAILGFAQILEMYDLSEQHKECVRHILNGGRHLLGLINEVLDISRIESGNIHVTLEPVSVADTISEAMSMVAPIAEQMQISLELGDRDVADQLVLADRQRLLQVIINLLSNGIKYNRVCGSVTVSHSVCEQGLLKVSIRDTGLGIGEEMKHRVFMPFDRLGVETKSQTEGTGLGLALSKSLVEAMNGSISFESVEGEGTVFELLLHLAEEAACLPAFREAVPNAA